MALPPRYGGLGIPVMMDMADKEYKFSCKATKLLKEAILKQDDNYTEDWTYSKGVKTEITTERNLFYRQKQAEIHQELESTEKQIFRETNLNLDLYYRLYIYHKNHKKPRVG